MEKTSVLQSELESCNQLQELEPLNKCKVSMCVCECVCLTRCCQITQSSAALSTPGCLLTVILLMRALDPLGYEKETLDHFQTLKVSDGVCGLWSRLCSNARFCPDHVSRLI